MNLLLVFSNSLNWDLPLLYPLPFTTTSTGPIKHPYLTVSEHYLLPISTYISPGKVHPLDLLGII